MIKLIYCSHTKPQYISVDVNKNRYKPSHHALHNSIWNDRKGKKLVIAKHHWHSVYTVKSYTHTHTHTHIYIYIYIYIYILIHRSLSTLFRLFFLSLFSDLDDIAFYIYIYIYIIYIYIYIYIYKIQHHLSLRIDLTRIIQIECSMHG